MSRKIVLYIASSLDGYIATPSHDITWLYDDQDYGYTQFYNSIDSLIMGRKTYDVINSIGVFPYKDKECFVVSTGEHSDNSYVQFITQKIVSKIKDLKKNKSKGNIWLVGGSQIIDFFLEHHLIDEIIVSVHPVLLGAGIPLFKEREEDSIQLELIDTKTFSTDLVQLHYEVKK